MNIPKTASLDPSREKAYDISVFSSRSINYNLNYEFFTHCLFLTSLQYLFYHTPPHFLSVSYTTHTTTSPYPPTRHFTSSPSFSVQTQWTSTFYAMAHAIFLYFIGCLTAFCISVCLHFKINFTGYMSTETGFKCSVLRGVCHAIFWSSPILVSFILKTKFLSSIFFHVFFLPLFSCAF